MRDCDFKKILSLGRGLREMTIASMFWYTDVRAKELRGMQLEDVDIDRGLIYVTSSKAMTGYRTIPIHPDFRKLISRYLEKCGAITSPHKSFFFTKRGTSFSESTIIHLIANIQRDLGLSFSCHDFRRAFVTR